MPGQVVPNVDTSHLFTTRKQLVADKRFDLHAVGSSQRPRVERYIAEQYRRTHNATIVEFMPVLLEMRCAGSTEAAVGFRPGCYRPLFLEQYLDKPIEQLVAGLSAGPVNRAGLVEVGNLAVTRKGGGLLLFALLATALFDAGFTWMVFTVTEEVERMMNRLGFKPHCLVAADPARLKGSSDDWGRYYQYHPKVMVGNLASAAQVINSSSALTELMLNYSQASTELAHGLADLRQRGHQCLL